MELVTERTSINSPQRWHSVRFSNPIIYVNALRLRIGRSTSVGFMTCRREANRTLERRSGKELAGFGLVLGERERAKGNKACVWVGCCQEDGQVYGGTFS